MKVWILVFVVAVWTQLPAEGDAKNLHPALRRVTKLNLDQASEIVKRAPSHQLKDLSLRSALVKRDDSSSSSSEEDLGELLRDFLEDEDVQEFLKMHPIGKMISEAVDNDDEIEAEDKEMVKALTILMLAGLDDSSEEMEERSFQLKKKAINVE